MMTKKDFVALARLIRDANRGEGKVVKSSVITLQVTPFTGPQVEAIAVMCLENNPKFEASRWLDYVRGADYGQYTTSRRRSRF